MKRKVTAVLGILAIAILASAATAGKSSTSSKKSRTSSSTSTSSSSSSGFGGIDADVGLPTTEVSIEYRLYACGGNERGQLGNDSVPSMTATVVPVFDRKPVALAAGLLHSLALFDDGTVEAWGDNAFGQLGYKNDLPYSYNPLVVRDLPPIKLIAAGWFHSLAVDVDGYVWTWGNNSTGQLGTGRLGPMEVHTPVRINVTADVVSLAGGMGHSLAITSQGLIYAWGNNFTAQLGPCEYIDLITFLQKTAEGLPSELPTTPEELWAWLVSFLQDVAADAQRLVAVSPTQIGRYDAKAVAAGALHSMMLMNDGTVRCWGAGFFGQLGDITPLTTPIPVEVRMVSGLRTEPLTDVTAIAGGALHSVARRGDGTVYAWGDNKEGQLGIGFEEQTRIPVSPYALKVKYLETAKAISSSYGHTLAILEDGSVWGWGSDWYGQLGYEIFQPFFPEPVTMLNISLAQSIAAGGGHSLIVAKK